MHPAGITREILYMLQSMDQQKLPNLRKYVEKQNGDSAIRIGRQKLKYNYILKKHPVSLSSSAQVSDLQRLFQITRLSRKFGNSCTNTNPLEAVAIRQIEIYL